MLAQSQATIRNKTPKVKGLAVHIKSKFKYTV